MADIYISETDYKITHPTSLIEVLTAIEGKRPARKLSLDNFGPITRKRFDYVDQFEGVELEDATITLVMLVGEHHYSATTMEQARVELEVWVPVGSLRTRESIITLPADPDWPFQSPNDRPTSE